MYSFDLQRLREVNWRIVLPIVVALSAIGYLVYQAVTASPGRELRQALPVTLKKFGESLLERDSGGLLRYRDTERFLRLCSRPAVEQCTALLGEIARRERRDPTFRFARFAIRPVQGGASTQSTSIDLVDNQPLGRTFFVLECRAVRMPDQTWKITEVKWHSLLGP